MRRAAQLLSWVALAGTLAPAGLYLADQIPFESVKNWTLAATGLWFLVTPFWMERGSDAARS